MTSSVGELPCYSLIQVANDLEYPSEGQLKEKFEHGKRNKFYDYIIKSMHFRWYKSENRNVEKIDINDTIRRKSKPKFDDVRDSILFTNHWSLFEKIATSFLGNNSKGLRYNKVLMNFLFIKDKSRWKIIARNDFSLWRISQRPIASKWIY